MGLDMIVLNVLVWIIVFGAMLLALASLSILITYLIVIVLEQLTENTRDSIVLICVIGFIIMLVFSIRSAF